MAHCQGGTLAKRSEYPGMIKALRTRLNKTQEQFAEILGVKQPTISAWERESGEDAPSAEMYLRLAALAPYPELLGFWELAGVKAQAIFTVAGHLLKERGTPPGPGETVRIPPMPGKTGELLILPTELIDTPLSTYYLIVDDRLATDIFTPGDVLLVDTSASGENLGPLWNKTVLIEFPPRSARKGDLDAAWPEGLVVGRLHLSQYDHHGFIWSAMVGDELVGMYQHDFAPNPRDPLGLPMDIAQTSREAARLAPEKIRLHLGCRLVGRMVAWFSRTGGKPKR